MRELIPCSRSIIPACDVDRKKFEEIIRETRDIPQVGAYKLGAALSLSVGLPRLVEIARHHTDKPLIYDHQKAATDIPETGEAFASIARRSGINAIILFPLSGPVTLTAWVKTALSAGLHVIVGGYMTHRGFLLSDDGYLDDGALSKIFTTAAALGVHDYVVPGNQPEVIRRVRELLQPHAVDPTFYAPGFIKQGGDITEAAKVAGKRWHAIVGRALYEAHDIQKAALALTSYIT